MDAMAKLVRIMWIPVLVAALYTGWIFWQRRTVEPPPRQIDPLASYGNGVKILQFYAQSAEIAPGGKTLVCYSEVNAKAMRLDPPVERVWPAFSRCFEVAPKQSTLYTLTAEGADHATVSQSTEIQVKR
jgi:hypothetical protein